MGQGLQESGGKREQKLWNGLAIGAIVLPFFFFTIRKLRAVLANTRLIRGKSFLGAVLAWAGGALRLSHLTVNAVYETRSSNLK